MEWSGVEMAMRYCRGPWAAFCLPQKCQRLFASEIKSEPSVKTVFANHQMEYESHCATNRSGVARSGLVFASKAAALHHEMFNPRCLA